MWKDELLSAEGIAYVGIVNGQPVVERVNPKYFNYEYSEDIEFIHDASSCSNELYMSITELYDRFYDKLSEAQLNVLLIWVLI